MTCPPAADTLIGCILVVWPIYSFLRKPPPDLALVTVGLLH